MNLHLLFKTIKHIQIEWKINGMSPGFLTVLYVNKLKTKAESRDPTVT